MLLEWLRLHQRIVIPLALLLTSLSLLSHGSYSRDAVHPSFITRVALSVIGAGQSAVSGTSGFFGDLFDRYAFLRGVEQENRELKRRLDRELQKNAVLQEQARENERLRRFLKFKEYAQPKNWAWIPAQVTAESPDEYNKFITINVGLLDGVKARLPVIAYDNAIVGQVLDEPGSAIALNQSQVLLITDRRSRVPVMIQRSGARAKGILAGVPETWKCEVLFTEQTSDIRPGDTIITSGYGQVFQKGWPVGLVEKVERTPASYSPRVLVQPFTEFNRLEEVMVIFNPEGGP